MTIYNRSMNKKFSITLAAIVVFLCSIGNILLANGFDKGQIVGTLVDSETGEPLIGANVFLENTMIGAASDLNGNFEIKKIPPGTYNLVVSMIGYAKQVVQNVSMSADEVKKLDLALKPEILESDEVVVTARLLENTEASLLKQRQKSESVSDAISAEAISRTGSGNAAEAMTQVTGASVVDGKYVYVRGLGERYSTTTLNGSEVPSADPEKKAVQMDLFPANLLDNIVTIKSFTPDKPGNFSGGMVDVNTKSYPDRFNLKVSTSTSYNTQATLNSNYLSYPSSGTDFLGFDNGLRELPAILKGNPEIPTAIHARRDPELAQQLDAFSKAFELGMAPLTKTAPVDQSYSLSVGNQSRIFGRPFGYLGSFSYKRNFSFYDQGLAERWQLPGSVNQNESLTPKVLLSDIHGSDKVTWGGLATFSYKLHNNHELSANVLYTQSGESSSRYLSGPWPEQFGVNSNAVFETRVLSYVERNLQSYQLAGDHFLKGLMGMKLDWKAAVTRNTQDEPDLRYFSDHYSERTIAGQDTVVYSISPGNYDQPARYFRNLQEDGHNFEVNLTQPFKQWSGLSARFKTGGFYSRKNRTFDEVRYQYVRPSNFRYNGDPQQFFSNDFLGIVGYDSTRNEYLFGNYIELAADPRGGDYDGHEKISAGYGMLDLPLTRRLRFIGGVRFETTRMEVVGADTTKADSLRIGRLDNNDFLPSINFVYQLAENMNLRAAYGRTLARPTLREKAPYVNFEFVNDYSFAGNVNLERTLIDNFDLRWEWFGRPGEIYAVSGFYKRFHNPIERSLVGGSSADNPEVTYRNVDEGKVFGLELEFRKRLDVVDFLKNFQLGMNLSLVHSTVDIPADKLAQLRQVDPNKAEFKSDTRPLQGQSPYVFNLDFAYDNAAGTSANLLYNVFGDRLAEVTSNATPDVYEKSRGMLSFNISQRVYRTFSIKLSAKNLLDSSIRFVHEYKGQEYVRRQYKIGRAFAFGVSYDL